MKGHHGNVLSLLECLDRCHLRQHRHQKLTISIMIAYACELIVSL